MSDAKKDQKVTTQDQHTPVPPALDEEITTMDQHTPAPPSSLGL